MGKLKKSIADRKEKIKQSITKFKLIILAKIKKFLGNPVMAWILDQDITFIFLFLALYLSGYQWNWKVLLASFGVWFVIKELLKHIRTIAREFQMYRK